MNYLLSLFAAFLLLSCNAQNSNSPYSEIKFESGACFGSCPIFTMTIASNRAATLEAERFNFTEGFGGKEDFSKPREGSFTTTIKKEDYERLVLLLNESNPKNLKNYYGNKQMTDLPTSYLTLNFKDGSKKVIQDYGVSGTENLSKIYDFINSLKKSQNWTKIK